MIPFKTAFFLFMASCLLTALVSCHKQVNFINEGRVANGINFYPVSVNPLQDLKNGGELYYGRVYPPGDTIQFELQFFSQDSIQEIDLFTKLGNGPEKNVFTWDYQPQFSHSAEMDTLVITYVIPSPMATPTSLLINPRIVNINQLYLERPFSLNIQ
ncbi:MAG: hypothetical protein ACYCOO_08640 [Chitinophagaceae bacterium]